jgi:hypothetical protein
LPPSLRGQDRRTKRNRRGEPKKLPREDKSGHFTPLFLFEKSVWAAAHAPDFTNLQIIDDPLDIAAQTASGPSLSSTEGCGNHNIACAYWEPAGGNIVGAARKPRNKATNQESFTQRSGVAKYSPHLRASLRLEKTGLDGTLAARTAYPGRTFLSGFAASRHLP